MLLALSCSCFNAASRATKAAKLRSPPLDDAPKDEEEVEEEEEEEEEAIRAFLTSRSSEEEDVEEEEDGVVSVVSFFSFLSFLSFLSFFLSLFFSSSARLCAAILLSESTTSAEAHKGMYGWS